jgi:hypothetical protein
MFGSRYLLLLVLIHSAVKFFLTSIRKQRRYIYIYIYIYIPPFLQMFYAYSLYEGGIVAYSLYNK